MKTIKFKPANSNEFINYIDIGSCERDYYFINFYLPNDHENTSGKQYFENYFSWFENFKIESMGSKMLILNYYLSEYMGWNNNENMPQQNYFASVYGKKTLDVINCNLDYLLQFNEKWFIAPSNIFKGLDLNWYDIEEQFVRVEYNENGVRDEIELDDGSIISFVSENDKVESFYVHEKDYFELKKEIAVIVNLFEP